ncbi:short-chain dehydrogenase [Asanoa ishikariensis]|uniref:NAD(P)-dependent dehydrogenase, short-chain alcohol dehydrogenase family n=1 Tax=Asanoa ishikariensis TaxID=137265 RepID=A0A1H3NSK0_9ACTN|nr:SDR family oxidoreductase [Asanoa ishikariensis]GIF68405.1 short-chain dehydrogenase [Asanoa ishikariensis]SDY91670.1 NAD(P)-dependent dehydrogenase, short-chain alcohol dehydrogenase family [Asanoa ishikariensis]
MSERTALVVGGTSGIGLAAARMLRQRGATVHIGGRGSERLAAVAGTDPELIGHRLDAGDPAAVRAVVAEIGVVDWLVVTVGGFGGPGPIADLDLAVLREEFDAKFWAQLGTIQSALPHLAPDGSITLLSAITARGAIPGSAGVAAINGAIEALVRPLAVELGPIRVNAVAPGAVDSPWWTGAGMSDEVRRGYFDQVTRALPTRRVATVEDIAEALVLVATNPNLTGTVIEADGGMHLVSL